MLETYRMLVLSQVVHKIIFIFFLYGKNLENKDDEEIKQQKQEFLAKFLLNI